MDTWNTAQENHHNSMGPLGFALVQAVGLSHAEESRKGIKEIRTATLAKLREQKNKPS